MPDSFRSIAFQALNGVVVFARQCVRETIGVAEIDLLREEIEILRSDVAEAKNRTRMIADAALLYERERLSDYDTLVYNALRRALRDANFAPLKERT